MIRGVVFDFDGTLVEQHIDFVALRAEIAVLAKRFSVALPRPSRPLLELLAAVEEAGGPDRRRRRFLEAAHAALADAEKRASALARPFPGAVALLRRMRAAGLATAVISRNSGAVIRAVMDRSGLECDCLLAREQVARVKPDPAHPRAALDCLGLKPSEALMVGDHVFDWLGGRRAGMRVAAVAAGPERRREAEKNRPWLVIDHVAQLAPFLDLEPLPTGKLAPEVLENLLRNHVEADPSVPVGPWPGRDAALVRTAGKRCLVVKSDPVTLADDNPGRYLVAVNANDVAVMGGRPRWLLATLVLPPGTRFSAVEAIFASIADACRAAGIAWAGGHTEVSPAVSRPLAAGTMLGEPLRDRARPGRARPGDALILVGRVGIEGASILARTAADRLGTLFPEPYLRRARDAARRPGLSVTAPALLAWRTGGVKLMHDPTEGGISAAIHELARLSDTGFRIERARIRFFPPAEKFCRVLGLDPLGLIASGCLLICAARGSVGALAGALRAKGFEAAVIGRAVPAGEGVVLAGPRGEKPLPFYPRDELCRLADATEKDRQEAYQ